MPAALHIVLTKDEDRTLSELRVAKTVSQRTGDRAHRLRLNAQGWTAPAIAEIFECQEQTVRETIRRWQQLGLGGLWDARGRGAKAKWLEADMAYLEQCLGQEPRTDNSQQLSDKLEQERGVSLSADRIRRIFQKRALAGSELGILKEAGKTPTTKRSNKQA